MSDDVASSFNKNIPSKHAFINESTMTDTGVFKKYVDKMRTQGTWGDDVEIQIISEIYKRNVEIYYAF